MAGQKVDKGWAEALQWRRRRGQSPTARGGTIGKKCERVVSHECSMAMNGIVGAWQGAAGRDMGKSNRSIIQGGHYLRPRAVPFFLFFF